MRKRIGVINTPSRDCRQQRIQNGVPIGVEIVDETGRRNKAHRWRGNQILLFNPKSGSNHKDEHKLPIKEGNRHTHREMPSRSRMHPAVSLFRKGTLPRSRNEDRNKDKWIGLLLYSSIGHRCDCYCEERAATRIGWYE